MIIWNLVTNLQILRNGDGISTRPALQSRVRVRSRGFLESGAVVDKHGGVWFTVGDGDVLQGIVLMLSIALFYGHACSMGYCCNIDGTW